MEFWNSRFKGKAMPNMNPTTQLSSQPGVLVEDKARAEENPNNAPPSNITYPAPLVAAVLVLALLLALLLVALDMVRTLFKSFALHIFVQP